VPRFKLIIEYNGARYSGWQIQRNARTIQGEIDRAARTVTGRNDFELYGSGRTDAGVHALAQVAHLDLVTGLPPATLVGRLNEELPADINVLTATLVPHRFHARRDAVARRYLYQIATRRTAFAKPFVWWVRESLNLERMRRAAGLFVGMHDFRSFAARDRRRDNATDEEEDRGSTVVLLERIDIVRSGDLVLIGIEGSHFLWKLVRRLVGVLVEVGRSELDPAEAAAMLTRQSEIPARLTAPASGLFLERVYYDRDVRATSTAPATPIGAV
jgi:tRNA pseudouridine38-40 synthase